MQHLRPNTTLQGGKYRIERVLGQGGFGITYLARNTVFDIDVAIKEFFMKDENDRNGSSVTMPNTTKQELFLGQMEKFKKEAKRMFAIKNEHIVGVQDLFEENGTAYYVMDYVDGESLAERLKRTGKTMTEQEVREILPQILDALKSVHDAGIWHLDLKPANIMLTKEGTVKLIDFGASKQLNAQKGGATTSTAISYTNGYAPREQMEQNYDKFGPWTDIYALGATLYNLLTNKRPPLPTDIDDDISEDKHEALPFPESVGADMKSFVLQMLKTNRLQRPQSISAIIEAEKTRGEEPKSTHKQQPTPKSSVDYDDETTIIVEPKPKKDENGTGLKVEAQSSIQSFEITSLNNNDNVRIRKGVIIGLAVILVFVGVLLYQFSHFNELTNTPDTEVIANDTEKNANAQDVMFEQSQIETNILMHLDSIAAELGQLPFPIFNNIKNTNINLYNPSIENITNDMCKLRLMGALDVNRRIAQKIGIPTNVFDNKIATLIDEVNYQALRNFTNIGMFSNLSYDFYKRMKSEGKINYYWQIAAATLVEQLYLISQNYEKIIKNVDDNDAADLSFRIVLTLDAVYRLTQYDSEFEKIAQAITPLEMFNATSVNEFKSQIVQAKENINSARRIIFN